MTRHFRRGQLSTRIRYPLAEARPSDLIDVPFGLCALPRGTQWSDAKAALPTCAQLSSWRPPMLTREMIRDLEALPSQSLDAPILSQREMAALRAALDTLGKQQWQSIDTAPMDGQDILLWDPEDEEPAIGRWSTSLDGWYLPGWDLDCEPSLWMPLPDLPASAARQAGGGE